MTTAKLARTIMMLLEQDVSTSYCWRTGLRCLEYDCPDKTERCFRKEKKK